MTRRGNIDKVLFGAACALLGSSQVTDARADASEDWTFDTALLYYGESDDRVQDLSLSLLGSRIFGDDRRLALSLSVDTLTGASASGAIALDRPQTFTSPSGAGTYTSGAGGVPLDDTFKDTRVAVSANWSQPLGRLYKLGAGFTASNEYDYFHKGVNFSLARDFNTRNTTLSAGLAFAQDDWEPVGGAPVPLSQMLSVGDSSNKRGDDSKDVLDVLLGVTQVVSRNTVVQVNYSYSQSDGYLNDPYKLLSVVDPISGDTLAFTPPPGSEGPDGIYRYESRPDSRARHGLFGRVKHYFGGRVLDLSYRFATDDWEIDSHTVDSRLRFPIGERYFIEPHVRYYRQTAADFYRSSLVDGEPLPLFASADFRLGDFDAMTLGVKYGRASRSGSNWDVRLEYYRQTGDVPDEQIIGNQAGREQYPDLSAVIAQFTYRFDW